MKKKLIKNKKDLDGKSTLIDIGSMTLGAGVAKGIEGLIAPQDTTMLNGGYLIVGALGNAFLEDKSTLGKGLKGLLTGMAIKGAFDLVSEFLSPKIPNDGKKMNKFIADMWRQGPVIPNTTTNMDTRFPKMNGYRPKRMGTTSRYRFVPKANTNGRPQAVQNTQKISLAVA